MQSAGQSFGKHSTTLQTTLYVAREKKAAGTRAAGGAKGIGSGVVRIAIATVPSEKLRSVRHLQIEVAGLLQWLHLQHGRHERPDDGDDGIGDRSGQGRVELVPSELPRAGCSLVIPAELGRRGGKRQHGKEEACQRIN